MNRLKIGIYTVLVVLVCLAAALLVPSWWVKRELGRADAMLRGAAAEVATRVAPAAAGATPGEGTAALVTSRTAGGVDLTSKVDGAAVRSSLPPAEADVVLRGAPSTPGVPSSAGVLPATSPGPGFPAVPLILVDAPAYRVMAVDIPGAAKGSILASVALAPALAPVATFQWIAFVILVLLLLIGLLLTASTTDEQRAVVPRQLVAVADRIARGDFSARAPPMAGSLGSISQALNRAAEEAGAAKDALANPRPDPFGLPPPRTPSTVGLPPSMAASEQVAQPTREEGRFASEPPPEAPPAPEAFEPAEEAPAEEPPSSPEPATSPAAAEEARPVPEPGTAPYFFPPTSPERTPAPAPVAEERTATAMLETGRPVAEEASRPVPAEAQAAGEVSPATEADEQHWQAVYDDFVRVRTECNERGRISFDRFRQKLASHRQQLVAKKGCRTVRFQVHVKDGKAAIKASPVR